MDVPAELTKCLAGQRLTEVQRREYDWSFQFGENAWLRVECPWRILLEGRIALASTDDGHKFGLANPVNAEQLTREMLSGKAVQRVNIRADTGDLCIAFDKGTALEALHMSAGYEQWEISTSGHLIVATGGGELAIFRRPTN